MSRADTLKVLAAIGDLSKLEESTFPRTMSKKLDSFKKELVGWNNGGDRTGPLQLIIILSQSSRT